MKLSKLQQNTLAKFLIPHVEVSVWVEAFGKQAMSIEAHYPELGVSGIRNHHERLNIKTIRSLQRHSLITESIEGKYSLTEQGVFLLTKMGLSSPVDNNAAVQLLNSVPESLDESTLTPEAKRIADEIRKLGKKSRKHLGDLSELIDLKYDLAVAINLPDPDDEDEKYALYGNRSTSELIDHLFGFND